MFRPVQVPPPSVALELDLMGYPHLKWMQQLAAAPWPGHLQRVGQAFSVAHLRLGVPVLWAVRLLPEEGAL